MRATRGWQNRRVELRIVGVDASADAAALPPAAGAKGGHMMRKRKVAWAVMAVVPVLVLTVAVGASAGTGKSAATTITVWAHQGPTREVAVLTNAVAAFNASQSDIDAKLRFTPAAGYTKTIQATPGGDLPGPPPFDG